MAVRSVLGAGRWRLIRYLLAESLLLATAGGALGIVLASVGVEALARLAPPEVPRIDQATLDLRVLGFAIALTFSTVLLFGLLPALMASRQDPNDALKQAGPRSSSGPSQTRIREWLIVSEVTLCVVLLVGAGLLLRSFSRLASVDPGFDPHRVLTFRLTLDKPEQEARRAMYSQTLTRLRALPGVESAAAVLIRPLSGTVGWDTVYAVQGQPPEAQLRNPNGNYEAVSPGYFATMGIRLLAGRDFNEADTHLSQGVVILNESTARRHWPEGGAVGSRIRLGRDAKAPWLTVVGVVGDVHYREWEASRPDLYVPYLQRAQHRTDFVVKTAGDPTLLAAAVRQEVFAIDRNQPISNLTTMDSLADRAISRSRFSGAILAALAACALALSAIGIYGVLSYSVAQRTREIGVRLAVGATRTQVAGLITLGGLRLVAFGVLAGIAAAAALSRLVEALLFGIAGLDPSAYLGSVLLLVAAAVFACIGPALRAAAVEPAIALRAE